MLTGQNINYRLLPLRKFVLQEGILKKKKKRKEVPTKKPKIAISVACILIRCQPLPNISIENGKNDVL